MTQPELARVNRLSDELRTCARNENIEPEYLRRLVAEGTAVIPNNIRHKISKPCAIGRTLATKINANIGTSKDSSGIANELRKMDAAVILGSDTVMDLSTGSKIGDTRRAILKRSPVPVGTVPIYEVIVDAINKHGTIARIEPEDMFRALETQAEEGVDFFTIHAGVTRSVISRLRDDPRIMGIVSRGGAFLAEWMISNDSENPFYEDFARVLDIAKRYDVTLSLGDGLRPGCIGDATDSAQVAELTVLGELQKKAFKNGVQVIIEGPGHVPIDRIEANVALEKSLCNGAPFYVLGPLVTDVAPGYDHITAAIGGAIAGAKGADFLCYVTPAEHLRLPTLEDVKEGVIASKIAAHAADIAKGVKGALEWDAAISKARRARDWKKQFDLAIDKARPKEYRDSSRPGSNDVCTMCGDYCSIKVSEKCFSISR